MFGNIPVYSVAMGELRFAQMPRRGHRRAASGLVALWVMGWRRGVLSPAMAHMGAGRGIELVWLAAALFALASNKLTIIDSMGCKAMWQY